MDTIRRDADVWTAMDRWKQFSDALLERFQAAEAKKKPFDSTLSSILVELADQGRIPGEDVGEVRAYAAQLKSVSNLPIILTSLTIRFQLLLQRVLAQKKVWISS